MLSHVFKYYDANGDGSVSEKELRDAIQQTGLDTKYFMAADTNNDGKITKDEFINFFDPIPDNEIEDIKQWLLKKQSDKATEMLLQIFAMYDKNGDNSLSLAEVTEGIKETGLTAKYFMQADKDGDSRISKEEWLQSFSPIPDADVEATKQWLAGKQ